MAYGMEVYNVAIKEGFNLNVAVLLLIYVNRKRLAIFKTDDK